MAKRQAKKKKPAPIQLTPEVLVKHVGSMMREMMDQVQKETGDVTNAVMTDAGLYTVGLPLPSLALEYLFCQTVMPFEKLYQLYGPPKIGKSGLVFEFMRWTCKRYGSANYLEHESKYNADWATSILNPPPSQTPTVLDRYSDRVGVINCKSVDDWQRKLQACLKYTKAKMDGTKEEPGPGRVYPYLVAIDSLVGKSTEEAQQRIATQGSAGRAFPESALSITAFLQATSNLWCNYPFLIISVNHEKKQLADQTGHGVTRPGGAAINFAGSIEFRVTLERKIRGQTRNGNRLWIQTTASGFGEDQRKIPVDLLWQDRETTHPVSGKKIMQQVTVFDWYGSTARMIAEGKSPQMTAARKLLGMPQTEKGGICKATKLNIKENRPFREVGIAIQKKPDLMEELRNLFSIRERKVFQPGVDYRKQILAGKMEEEQRRLALAKAPAAPIQLTSDEFPEADEPEPAPAEPVPTTATGVPRGRRTRNPLNGPST